MVKKVRLSQEYRLISAFLGHFQGMISKSVFAFEFSLSLNKCSMFGVEGGCSNVVAPFVLVCGEEESREDEEVEEKLTMSEID